MQTQPFTGRRYSELFFLVGVEKDEGERGTLEIFLPLFLEIIHQRSIHMVFR